MEIEPTTTGLLGQVKELVATGLSALQNRLELFLLEVEEEKTHLMELLVWTIATGLLALMFLVVFTALVVMLFPKPYQVWAVGGFCVLYLIGAIVALFNLKAILKNGAPPFSGSVSEMKKDHEWLDSSR